MSEPLIEGSKAPAFSLSLAGGGTVSLKQYKGQKLVIFFYPRNDTPGCAKEAQNFSDLYEEFLKSDTGLLGISADSIFSHENFKAKYDLKMPMASDLEQEAINAFGVWKPKYMFGRKQMAVARATFLINSSGKIAKIWENVKLKDHAEIVLRVSQELE